MSALLKELRFSIPWGHLAAKSWGPSEGQRVLCLHGWLDNANTFDRLIPLLPKDYHYVALDFSGHGMSSHIPQGMRYQHLDYVTDIHRVVTALGWKTFSILAHSMGGVAGGLFASTFPDSVRQLILLDSYGFFPIDSDSILNHLKKAITHYSRLEGATTTKVYTQEGALQRLLEANQSLTPDTAKILLQRGTKSVPGGVTFTRDIRVTVNNAAPLSIAHCLEIMKNIKADVHIIMANSGLADQMQVLYPDMAQALLQGYKERLNERCRLSVVDGNHFVHLNEPEKVSGIITDILLERTHIHSQL
ncbi:serine hydrolase-like protein 2 [Spea bombifrons]|uniref:serine hydrolase-like protein 2 n=1 Tax=Spea bombifrons TaxID=233779 RepID=UPI002349D2D2|nr:serine hydrolase-like protein 2 [Spea bombifrons]